MTWADTVWAVGVWDTTNPVWAGMGSDEVVLAGTRGGLPAASLRTALIRRR